MIRALCVVLAALIAAAALPAAAHATLAYNTNVTKSAPSVYAAHDGTAPHRLGAGQGPDLSPDGPTVVWAGNDFAKPTLIVSPTATSGPRTLLKDWGARAPWPRPRPGDRPGCPSATPFDADWDRGRRS
ncbi:MAG: hypothetical protein JWN65_2618 [Solirubrobacterales bacterium]|nr:hypothetical protein [Solirubrobacterales bacterium]